MLLVAGGQLDPNIGALLRRCLQRRENFKELLVGPQLRPRIHLDIERQMLTLDGIPLSPTSCFIRHDVFLHEATRSMHDTAASLNWYFTVRGYVLSNPTIRLLNRRSYSSENNKIENLLLAKRCGLPVPPTIITNDLDSLSEGDEDLIQKPVAGGSLTTTLRDHVQSREQVAAEFPRFIQRRLLRPEIRVYQIGDALFGYELSSQALDYRSAHDVTIQPCAVHAEVVEPLQRLATMLGLDFSASDFMRDETGQLYFLEINTQPMFAAFDRVSDGRLCDAILDHLTKRGDEIDARL